MKTAKIYSVLSLVLIFAALTSTSAGSIGNLIIRNGGTHGIQHQVNIYLNLDKPLCNTYLIEIRDGSGQLVAPAQAYVSGISKYNFFERGPASGIRVARLVRATFGHHYVCDIELFTKPAVIKGAFENGQVYRYDLYPSAEQPKE